MHAKTKSRRATSTVDPQNSSSILCSQFSSSQRLNFNKRIYFKQIFSILKNLFSFIGHNPFAQSSVIEMYIITFLALSTAFAIFHVAAAPAFISDTTYSNGIVAKYDPKGLLAGFFSATEPTSRATNLAKRDPETVVNAPCVGDHDLPKVEVTACSDINFSGGCVLIRSFPGQCGR